MYHLPRDLALKKKKQALRRLSQSGTQGAAKPLISPIHAGKKLPGLTRGGAYGGKSKPKNPFQLATTTSNDSQESTNPFSSVPQASKPPQFPVQSGQLFKSSGNEFSNNPFVTSSASSFSTAGTSGASLVGRSYAQALKTGGRLSDPRLEHATSVFTSSKPDPIPNSGDMEDRQPAEQHDSSQNPFAKASSGLTFQKSKHAGVQGKMQAGAARLNVPAPSTLHQYVVTLSVRNIEKHICTPEILHSHFQQFGNITDLKCMPRKGMATVSYSDHKAALRAKQQGTILDQGYPPLHIVLQKKRPVSSSQPGEGERRRNIPSDYVWVHPSMQLAAREDGVREVGLQTEKSPMKKGSIFSRLGNPVGGAEMEKQDSLKVQPEAKQKYSPRRQDKDEEYVPGKEDWEQEEHDVNNNRFEQNQNITNTRETTVVEESAGDTMDTIARHVGHSYDLRSLHRGTGGGDIDSSTGVAPVSLVGTVSSTVTKPSLPPGPTSSLTAAQAYEALDERDTQIRKTMVKQTSLATAQAIVGTCPDMCPEKERYRRESIKRLSIFEMLSCSDPQNPQVDHTKAVKEYSGSAADKDEPLPHELRPPHVLAMTMDYLVTMVINNHSAEGSGEWFNFIWNRTRAVRKDITLQHLCSPVMVDIVEKCARFHILCGHLMCEEDVSVFDAKMNSDNLSKCLQTLKEFYRDLRRKGTECHNEAEFCCYDILLHLNEGDVLCKIDDYTPGIYKNPLVHFAIQVTLAWSNNNFVRFFRLVRSTSYLNSCLLHRYFNQVRSEALNLLLRTHTAIKQSSYIPVEYMQEKMLYTENQEQVVAFCCHYGIRVEERENGNRFVLSRDAYLEPDKPFDTFKSRELVEQKNNRTFGEVVQGGPLPAVPNHIPVSSFSNKALLQSPVAVATRISYDEKDILVVVDNVVSEVTQSEITLLSANAISEVQQLYAVCDQVGVGLIDDVIVISCREISQEAFAEEKERIRQLKEERERLLNTLAWSFVSYLVEQTTFTEIGIITQDSLMEERLLAEIRRNAIDHVMLQMAGIVVAMEIRAIIEESIREAIVQRKQSLNFIASNVIRNRTAKHFAYWRRATLRCQQVKKCLETFPPSAPLHPLSWLLEQLQPSEKRPRLDLSASPLSLLQNRTSALTTVIDKFNKTEEERKQFWSPVSIPDLVYEHLMTRLQSPPPMEPANSWAHHQWQLLLVLPPTTCAFDISAVHWLKSVLSSAPPLLPTNMDAVELLSLSDKQKMKVIVKSLQGFVPSGKQEMTATSLKGTSAILMYSASVMQVSELVEQLNTFIVNIKQYPRVPLLVLCDDATSLTATETATIEETLCASFPVLSATKIVPYSLSADFTPTQQFNHQHRRELCEAVRWLALNSSLPPVLTWQPLYDYMEQGLLELFVQPLMTDHKLRLTLAVTPQPCRGVVTFYNSAVEHLALIATSENLAQFSWPCKEISSKFFSFKGAPPIHWNEPDHLAHLNELIMNLQIMPLNDHKDESSFEHCLNFVKSVCEVHQVPEPLPLITNVHKILQQTDDHVSWPHIITMCMSHLLKSISPDWWVCHCYEEKRPTFKEPPEWLTCLASTTLARVQQHSTPKIEQNRSRAHRRHWTDPFSGSIIVNSNYSSPNNESMKKKLVSTLEQERLLSKEFDDLLIQYTSQS